MKKISALAVAGVFAASLAGTAFAEMTDLKISGEIRVRDEVRNNYDDLDSSASSAATVISQRTRVNVDAKVNETTKAYLSLQDTRNWGSEATTATTGNEGQAVDVSQAYVQLDKLFDQPLSLKLGRQVLSYGDQRLIGGFEWSDNARRFDAIKLMYNTDAFNIDLFFANVAESDVIGTVNPTTGVSSQKVGGRDGNFNGLYATLKTIPMNSLDLYLLQKVGTAGGENVLTYGARLNGGTMNIDWTAEFALQGGDTADNVTKEASAYALKAGYTLADVMGLRIGAEYDFASGDKDATDKKDQNFDNLYPTNHGLYGVSDFLEYWNGGNAFSDLKAMSINVGVKPADGLRLLAEYWIHSSDQEFAAGKTSIGNEINLQAWYALNKNVDLHAYYAQFTPSSDLSDAMFAGKTDAATNAVLQLAVKF